MTAHKYFSIVFRWQFTETKVYWMIVAVWLLPIAAVIPFAILGASGTLLGLQPSYNYCFVAMEGKDTINIVATVFILVVIVGTIIFLIFAHSHILVQYKKWQKAKMDRERLRKEGVLIKKSLAISGIFSFAWSFFIWIILYELCTHTKVSAAFDVFWLMLGASIPVLNLIILYIYDAKFSQNIREFWRLISNPGSAIKSVARMVPLQKIESQVANLPTNSANILTATVDMSTVILTGQLRPGQQKSEKFKLSDEGSKMVKNEAVHR